MAFTKITHAGIGSTGTVLLENLEVTGVGTFGGSVSVGGTLTYEDVTNVDSVGLITARNGVVVGSGITLSKDGDIFATGVTTSTTFSGNFSGGTVSGTTGTFSGDVKTTAATVNIKSGSSINTNSDTSAHGALHKNTNSGEFAVVSGGTGGNNYLNFYTSASGAPTAKLRITHTGQLLHGHNASIGLGRDFETSSTSGYGGIAINRFSADTGSGGLDFVKSRNASLGGNTIVQSDDNIGAITWRGADGTDFATPAAQIKVAVDGTPGSNDMPGRIMFNTTADGASSVTERLRIASGGNVQVNGGAVLLDANGELAVFETDTSLAFTNSAKLTFDFASNVARIRSSGNGSFTSRPLAFFITNDEKVRITSTGLGIGGITPNNALDVQAGTTNTAIVARSTDSKAQISLVDNSTTSVGSVVVGAEGDALFFTSGSGGNERLRVDSAGRLMLGTTTEGFATYGDKFTIADSGHCGMTIRSGSSNYGTIYFSDGDDGSAAEVRGFVEYNHSTNLLSLGSDGTSRLRLDSGGKIELGATSGPSARLDPSSNGELYIEADPNSNYGSSNIRFRVDNVEVARMVAGTHRYFGLGRTASQSNARMDINNESDQDVLFLTQNTNNQTTRNLVMLHTGASGGFAPQIVFMDNQGGIRGTIKNNTSSTQYNTSSDYRLKENEVVISDGIERIKQLKPYRFNWKNRPDTIVDGFFAHEVQNIVEDCVEGTKDEVYTEDNDDLKIKAGDPKYQEMDHSKLVPLLTAALKEAISKIEVLEAKVAALEG